MHKVLVLGASGLIGHTTYRFLFGLSKYEIYNFTFSRKLNTDSISIDARNESKFFGLIKEIKPDFIINCIGVLIQEAEYNPDQAIFLNAYLPHKLKNLADNIGSKLIHISTDCVFSGEKGSAYMEHDRKDSRSIYGITKGLGELIHEDHLTLRTSVVGPELKSNGQELFNWFMSQTNSINGYMASIWSGVTTHMLARAIECSIVQEITGIHHVTNNSAISKYELLKLFQIYTNKDLKIIPVEGIKSDKSFIDSRRLLKLDIPSYDKMISDMIIAIKEDNDLYPHYKIQ